MLPQDLKQLQLDKDFNDKLAIEVIKAVIVFGFIILLAFC